MKKVISLCLFLGLTLWACTPTTPEETEVAVQSVTMSQPSAEMLVGETVQLYATVVPSNATDKTIRWASSKQSVATVSDKGLVTAAAEGSATITASAGGKTASCTITVSKGVVAVSSVTLDKTSVQLLEGESVQLTATVLPNDATDKTLSWSSSDSAVASVDNSGKVTAVKKGQATVTVKAGDKSASCTVTVDKAEIAVTGVSLDKNTLIMEVGQDAQLLATVSPDDATDKTVSWSSSDESVATVSQAGKVEALKVGQATITARAGGKEATCAVTVVSNVVPVESITLDKTSLSLIKGEAAVLNATVLPADATDKTVSWSSSNPAVARVDQDGIVTATGGGRAAITAKAGGKSAVCNVTVTVPVESVTLSKTSLTLDVGSSETLTATVNPADATDKSVSWSSSDTSIAQVDQNGIVTAVKGGNAVITAKAGEKTATCSVKVTVPVQNITLDKTALTLAKGEKATLTATVSPADATDKTVTWSSTDPSVAQVDQNGVVSAIKGGSAVIKAQAGGKSAVCGVTVTCPVESVSLDKTSLTLEVGQTFTLTATVYPSDATDKTVSWSSSDESVATVDNAGKVTAVKKGDAVITAKAGGKTATCQVKVNNVAFAISPSSASFPGKGGTLEVRVTCSSSYHLNSKPDWVSETSVQGNVHTYTIAANPNAAARSGVLVFCDDEGVCLPCSVKQAAGGAFSVSPGSVELGGEGGTFQVTITCSTGYHINSKPDWVTEIQDGADIQLHVFQVGRNTSEEARSGVIVFCDDQGICLPCAVKQKGRDPNSVGGGNEDVNDGDPVKW